MAPGPDSLPVVAAFDVDGTLTTRDCVVPFLREFVGTPRLVLALLRRPVRTLVAGARRDRDALKALALSACRGRSLSEAEQLGSDFMQRRISGWLRDDTTARLRWHLDQGHRVVLVSASLRPYLEPLASHLGAAAALCTTFEVDPGGRLTGRLAGANCRGEEKVRRLRGWLGDEHVRLYAYGDSAGDNELLAIADRPTWVHGSRISAVPA